MGKPLIGITPQFDPKTGHQWIRPQYIEAILKSGGLPILLMQYENSDETADLLDSLGGILFSGGEDIHPKRYGEEVDSECGEIVESRDNFELSLYMEAIKINIPILGICRGLQLINVAAGGTLYQHINGHSKGIRHDVSIKKDSLLFEIFGFETINTNSYHHQAIRKTAPPMIAAAWSNTADSGEIIEAIYDSRALFNVSVQWHPENMYTEDEYSHKLFDAFVSAAASFKKTR